MTNMLVDFIKRGTPVNFLFHLQRPGQYQLFSQDLWQGGWKSGLLLKFYDAAMFV